MDSEIPEWVLGALDAPAWISEPFEVPDWVIEPLEIPSFMKEPLEAPDWVAGPGKRSLGTSKTIRANSLRIAAGRFLPRIVQQNAD